MPLQTYCTNDEKCKLQTYCNNDEKCNASYCIVIRLVFVFDIL
jgi:hypothetical protein